MSFGYSADFRRFDHSTPPATPHVPPPSGGRTNGPSPTRRFSLPGYLLWPLLLIVALVGIAVVVNIFLEPDGAVTKKSQERPNDSDVVPVNTPTPAPTVLVVDNANPTTGNNQNAGNVFQPNVVYVPYPVIVERQVVVPQAVVTYANPSNVQYVNTGYSAGPVCGGSTAYVVRQGDTVFGLSRRFGVGPESIVSMNGLWDPNYIRIGQVLHIPCASTY